MSKIRFIFAIILSFSILSNGLLAEEMHSVPSELIRKKRTPFEHDIIFTSLFDNTYNYRNFINSLRSSFANGNTVQVGSQDISVARNNSPVTLVTLGISDVNINFPEHTGSVTLVFRNSDLYIIGFVRNHVFYRLNEDEYRNITVDNTTTVDLNIQANYNRLVRRVGNLNIPFHDPNELIRNFIDYERNRNEDNENKVAKSIMLFAIMFSEAVRFYPVQHIVQRAIDSSGQIDFRGNVYYTTQDGEQRATNWQLFNLIRNWETFSLLTTRLNDDSSPIQMVLNGAMENVNRDVLVAILALAKFCGPGGRSLRDTESYSPDKCYLGEVGREGIMIGNTYWSSDSIPILTDEIAAEIHAEYGFGHVYDGSL